MEKRSDHIDCLVHCKKCRPYTSLLCCITTYCTVLFHYPNVSRVGTGRLFIYLQFGRISKLYPFIMGQYSSQTESAKMLYSYTDVSSYYKHTLTFLEGWEKVCIIGNIIPCTLQVSDLGIVFVAKCVNKYLEDLNLKLKMFHVVT